MEQINTASIYFLGKWMDSVFLQAKMPSNGSLGAWVNLRSVLSIALTGEASLKLNESAPAASHLMALVDQALAKFQSDEDTSLSETEVRAFNQAWGTFEQALALDLGRAPVFFVTPKGIYSTPALINSAELSLVPDVLEAISPEAKKDLNQSGRCLAFEMGTASAYHGLRAVEKVLREYYECLLKARAGNLGMKQCIDQIKAHGGDEKTLAVLDQLRDLHRNPIDHPDVFLNQSEAMEVFNICTSAISAMARQIRANPKCRG